MTYHGKGSAVNVKYSSGKCIIYIGIRDAFCQSEHGLISFIQIFFCDDDGGGGVC